jgi:ubiquinone/menaquinone biosynthesis C-methylase UbiE
VFRPTARVPRPCEMSDSHRPSEVLDSNIAVHTTMAETYERDEPHFRPENKARVQANLLHIAQRTGTGRLLDVGCGTGFVISLLAETFDEIHGIDPTPAMLQRVDASRGNITLHEGVAEQLPFPDGSFDLVTAYSVYHHLADHRPALAEAARVLRPGGVLYVDLEPNRAFWSAIDEVERTHARRLDELDEIVAREVDAVLHVEDEVHERFAIDPEVFRAAEHIKSHLGGFDPAEFESDARAAGFARCETTHEWFLGQAALIHGPTPEDATTVEHHLRRVLPVTAYLFKYLRFEATK